MSERSPETIGWDLLRGALTTRAYAIVAELGVAHELAEGPRPVEEVARAVGADADVLYRLLRALASDGVFAEQERGVFANTPVSERMLDESVSAFAHLFGGVFHRTAGALEAGGKPSFAELHGTDFWTWLGSNPTERSAFDRAMGGRGTGTADRLATVQWRGDETVVDVGGGNGALLVELVRRSPGLRGIVFDLPETDRDEAALGDRVAFVSGSFFERVPEGDVYVLSGILHDWDDESAAAILRTIREAAHDGARLLVLDSVVPAGNEPHGAKWLDLLMLALLAGRERDAEQWKELLASGGFEPVSIEDGLIEARCR
jgi:O-methyltransferase domain